VSFAHRGCVYASLLLWRHFAPVSRDVTMFINLRRMDYRRRRSVAGPRQGCVMSGHDHRYEVGTRILPAVIDDRFGGLVTGPGFSITWDVCAVLAGENSSTGTTPFHQLALIWLHV